MVELESLVLKDNQVIQVHLDLKDLKVLKEIKGMSALLQRFLEINNALQMLLVAFSADLIRSNTTAHGIQLCWPRLL